MMPTSACCGEPTPNQVVLLFHTDTLAAVSSLALCAYFLHSWQFCMWKPGSTTNIYFSPINFASKYTKISKLLLDTEAVVTVLKQFNFAIFLRN
jgi:hypothetical protein